jgi:hypothetical protein
MKDPEVADEIRLTSVLQDVRKDPRVQAALGRAQLNPAYA